MASPRKTVTEVRPVRAGFALVVLDGAPWRTLPVEALAVAGIGVGVALDRGRLRTLRRELRRDRAVSSAVDALRHRDRSAAELDARLARKGVTPADRASTLAALGRAGLVDDERLAARRAETLAERGSGDALIRDDLERRGLGADLIAAALAALDPERERAARIVSARGGGVKTARFLAARGFGEEALEHVIAETQRDAVP